MIILNYLSNRSRRHYRQKQNKYHVYSRVMYNQVFRPEPHSVKSVLNVYL